MLPYTNSSVKPLKSNAPYWSENLMFLRISTEARSPPILSKPGLCSGACHTKKMSLKQCALHSGVGKLKD